jgi:hypothetical protein
MVLVLLRDPIQWFSLVAMISLYFGVGVGWLLPFHSTALFSIIVISGSGNKKSARTAFRAVIIRSGPSGRRGDIQLYTIMLSPGRAKGFHLIRTTGRSAEKGKDG